MSVEDAITRATTACVPIKDADWMTA